jgi:hypothetical protein
MDENVWKDLYIDYGQSSNVFEGARNTKFNKYAHLKFKDPPGIEKKANNSRKLEFDIELEDVYDKKIKIEAEQNLATDADNIITKQEFDIKRKDVGV